MLPHVGLADAYVAIGTRDLIDPNAAYALAESHAHVSLDLAPDLAEAHPAMAAIREVHHWNWPEAERLYCQATQPNATSATAMQWYALHLARRGRHEEARLQMERSGFCVAIALLGLIRVDEAFERLERTIAQRSALAVYLATVLHSNPRFAAIIEAVFARADVSTGSDAAVRAVTPRTLPPPPYPG